MTHNSEKSPLYVSSLKIRTKSNGILIVNISESPHISRIVWFSYQMRKKGVSDVFCFCNLKYNPSQFMIDGILFHHLPFEDGIDPPQNVLTEFDCIIKSILIDKKSTDDTLINLHCNTGLGRAPAMLAYLLLKYEKIDRFEVIKKIRNIRKDALTQKQLEWVQTYKIINDDIICRCVIA